MAIPTKFDGDIGEIDDIYPAAGPNDAARRRA